MIIIFKVFHRLKAVQQAQKGVKKAKNAHQKSPNRKKRSNKQKRTVCQRFAFSKRSPVLFISVNVRLLIVQIHNRKPVSCSACTFNFKIRPDQSKTITNISCNKVQPAAFGCGSIFFSARISGFNFATILKRLAQKHDNQSAK